MKALLFALATLTLASCTDEDVTKKVLTEDGYKDIEIQGHAWIGCGKDDTFKTKFTAINPAGNKVTGVVCCGFMKECTIRRR